MSNLFVLPHQVPLSSAGALLPAAQLFFFATGSSTPQDTYTDVNLTTPSANPVVADANGVFPAIYFDPSLPNYRVTLKTAANVTLYTQDDVPSNANTAQTFRLKSPAPELIFEETDASANNKKWSIRVNGEQMEIDLLNDAESVRTAVATVTRVGTASGIFNFTSGFLFQGGQLVATRQFNNFTATLTGMSGITGTVLYELTGAHCALYVPAAIVGTSTSTALTLTGLPTACKPVTAILVPCVLFDNGAGVLGTAFIAAGGSTITFSRGVDPPSATGFSATGTKGLSSGFTLVYPTFEG